MKVSELCGGLLDGWVAKAEGMDPVLYEEKCWVSVGDGYSAKYNPSTDWATGGPIAEREKMQLDPFVNGGAIARMIRPGYSLQHIEQRGETYLIAICRCYVASKFGEEVQQDD